MYIGFLKAMMTLEKEKINLLLKKVIRECYQVIVEKPSQTFNCAERTFGLSLLVYFDFNLGKMAELSLSDLLDLFLGTNFNEKAMKKVLE